MSKTDSPSGAPDQAPADPPPADPPPADPPPANPPAIREIGGRKNGLDPTRYGDWEKNGRCIDF